MRKPIRRALIATLATAGLLLSSVAVAPSWAVPSYPSAEEVAAAKKKVADKKAMIARLEKILEDLTTEADALAKTASIKAETYNIAQDAVDAVQTKVDSLQTQADAATAAAKSAERELGQIAAQMYRDGASGTSLNLFLNAGAADDLLYKLGAQERLAGQSNEVYQKSIALQKQAKALTDELNAAKSELAGKAAIAKAAYDEATSAASAAQDKVVANEKLNKTFYAQLASLRNTSASLEKQREEGLAAERRQKEGTAKMDAPELYTVGDANSGLVQTAIDFGKTQLGEAYVLGGMGPDVWDCSGLTKASYAAAGIYIGTHSATNQFRTMAQARKLVPLSQMQVGDLLWYSTESAFDGDKYHVVIFVGGGLMLEAPNPARTVRIVPIRWGEMFPYAGRPTAP
ncbi:MAG: C40 family peptidase [Actinomycetales bacterium]|nr:C40 family peptidase [Actinomycetales bacterium]